MRVLEEDEYIQRLGEIIRRDFFPDLSLLEAQYEYLVALEQNDLEGVALASKKLDGLHKPKEGKEELSLSEFQQRFTSEDNASFEHILEDMNRKRQQKFKWILEQKEEYEKTQLAIVERGERNIGTWKHTSKNMLMYNSDEPSSKLPGKPSQVNVKNTRFPVKMSSDHYKTIQEIFKTVESIPTISQKKYEFVPMSPFKVPPTPKREEIGIMLSARARERERNSTPKQKIGLSPAARNLMRQIKGKKDSQLKRAYTPKRTGE